MTIRALEKEILDLPPRTRVRLAEKMIESVDDFTSKEIEDAWSREVGRRIEEIESGKVREFPPLKQWPKHAESSMKPVKYHPLAESELVDSAAFYEQRREFLGHAFLDFVEETPVKVQNNPEIGKPGKFKSRSWKMRRFPFRIVYLIQAERLWIIAVAHLSRRPGYWAERLE